MTDLDMSAFEDALKSVDNNKVRGNLTDLAQDIGHFQESLREAGIDPELRGEIVMAYVNVAFTPQSSAMPLLAMLGGLGKQQEEDD